MDTLTLEEKLELLQKYGAASYKDSEVELSFHPPAAEPMIPVEEGDFTVDWSGAQIMPEDEAEEPN